MAEIPDTPKQEIKLFYCYAHEDKALRDELQVNLAGLKRQYRLNNWYDREILPGEKWEEAIDTHLSTADVILLLISPHFVDSDYCYSKEMQRALERYQAGNCCIIPILLRPTYWENTPLGTIQMLPTGAKPITSWPDRYEAFYNVAKGISIAIKTLLIARSPVPIKEWIGKGETLYRLKRYEEALTTFEKAIHLNPKYVDAYNGKGWVLYRLERYEEALTTFVQTIHLDPICTDAHDGRGWTLYRLKKLKRYEEALTVFEHLIALDPTYTSAYDGKGWTLYRLKRYEEALTVFEHLVTLDPTYTSAYDGKGNTLQKLGKTEEAEQVFEKARQLGLII